MDTYMQNAKKLELETSVSYSIISNFPIGRISDNSGINDGDSVTLRYHSEWINVELVERIGEQLFQGTISGFDPSISVTFKDLKLGEKIKFNEQNIFSCTRAY